MKKTAFFLCLFIIQIFCHGQQMGFFYEWNVPENWNFAGTDVLEFMERESGQVVYFVSACDLGRDWYTYESESIFPAKVFKLSSKGELLGELTVGEEGRRSTINRLFIDPDNADFCLAVGKIHDNDRHYDKPLLAKFDHDLNLI